MQERLFYEDVNEALRELVNTLGGAKKIGPLLWPEKTIEQAHTLLLACFNTDRRERLTPEQVIFLLRKGREGDCHIAMRYIAQECGYAPPAPVNPQDRQLQLLEEFNRNVERLEKLAEHIRGEGGLAALKAVR